ncbi:hypothetical protein L596_001639 [Steinernema carpocapsae]|uniref:Uncharacterized protein n=1 Tax=Steinernema carpocapsae TaxID=34508 RepID=A0A4U8UM17_STECR|nr:hypothetical protein L596_001639 [Steinernema carpocapsae]
MRQGHERMPGAKQNSHARPGHRRSSFGSKQERKPERERKPETTRKFKRAVNPEQNREFECNPAMASGRPLQNAASEKSAVCRTLLAYRDRHFDRLASCRERRRAGNAGGSDCSAQMWTCFTVLFKFPALSNEPLLVLFPATLTERKSDPESNVLSTKLSNSIGLLSTIAPKRAIPIQLATAGTGVSRSPPFAAGRETIEMAIPYNGQDVNEHEIREPYGYGIRLCENRSREKRSREKRSLGEKIPGEIEMIPIGEKIPGEKIPGEKIPRRKDPARKDPRRKDPLARFIAVDFDADNSWVNVTREKTASCSRSRMRKAKIAAFLVISTD